MHSFGNNFLIAFEWNTEQYKLGIEVFSDNESSKLEAKEQIDAINTQSCIDVQL